MHWLSIHSPHLSDIGKVSSSSIHGELWAQFMVRICQATYFPNKSSCGGCKWSVFLIYKLFFLVLFEWLPLSDCSIQVNDNTNRHSVKSNCNRFLEADITVIDGKQIREINNRPLNTGRQLYTVPLNRGSNVYPLRRFLHHNHIVELPPGVLNNNINLTQL